MSMTKVPRVPISDDLTRKEESAGGLGPLAAVFPLVAIVKFDHPPAEYRLNIDDGFGIVPGEQYVVEIVSESTISEIVVAD